LYSELPTQDDLYNCWVALIKGALKSNEWIEIFTANYDQIIEVDLESIELGQENFPKIKTRRTYGMHPQLYYRNLQKGGIYTKLHGSIDWTKKLSQKALWANLRNQSIAQAN
jgi:hypothetical protein